MYHITDFGKCRRGYYENQKWMRKGECHPLHHLTYNWNMSNIIRGTGDKILASWVTSSWVSRKLHTNFPSLNACCMVKALRNITWHATFLCKGMLGPHTSPKMETTHSWGSMIASSICWYTVKPWYCVPLHTTTLELHPLEPRNKNFQHNLKGNSPVKHHPH